MAAALEGEKGQCWKAWREGLQGCGDGHVHLGPVAALGSAGSWRPGAFRDAPLECAQPVCGPGGLRVPCAPVLGARSPAAGGEHQGEESGQLRPPKRVRQAPRAGARTRKPTERSESGREHERGMHGMARGPEQEEWALVARRAAEEAARRRSRSGSSRGKIAISPLRSPLPARPRQRPAFIRGSANLAPPRSPRGP